MDEREFEARVRACTQRLFHICYAILPGLPERQDAVQEALLKAWQHRGSLRNEAYFETWLIRIAINECKNGLRRRKHLRETALTEDVPADADIPNRALRDALLRLEVNLRLPLVLRYVEGYSLDETAKLLKLPMGTLKHRLTRGKRLLKAELEGEGGEDNAQ